MFRIRAIVCGLLLLQPPAVGLSAAALAAERGLILVTLERTRWNRVKTARLLSVSYKTLLTKMKQSGLS